MTRLLLMAILCVGGGAGLLEASVIDKVKESRARWVSGEVDIHVLYERPVHNVSYEKTFKVYFDKENIRYDRQEIEGPGKASFLSIDIVSPTAHINYVAQKTDAVHPVVSGITNLDYLLKSKAEIIPDPRFVGLAACAFESLRYYQRGFCITQEIEYGISPVVSEETYLGNMCYV